MPPDSSPTCVWPMGSGVPGMGEDGWLVSGVPGMGIEAWPAMGVPGRAWLLFQAEAPGPLMPRSGLRDSARAISREG